MASLANYRIIRQLGGGSFGKVKRKNYAVAEHRVTSSLVAIKILNKREIQERNLMKKVKREVQILESLDHPNVIKLYEVIETSTNILLAMEFLPGGELYNVIERNGKLPENQARVYFQQLIAGIDYIHQKGYSHRDLKPENILLDKDGYIKIGDFGLSNLMPVGDYLKTSCGSPNYAAPEVVSGTKYCGNEVDVWSLGVVLYCLVSGRLPFDESTIPALFNKIKAARFDMPYYFSDTLKDLILRILTIDPISRITVAQILKHQWVNVGIPYPIICKRILKELYSKQINIKVLKDTISYPEFANINIQTNVIDVITGTAKDEFYIMPIYKIFLDIEISKKRKEIQSHPIKSSIFKPKNIECFIVDGSTKASSCNGIDHECAMPSNWVYGFRCNLQPYYFIVKLAECFNAVGLKYKRISAFRLKLKKSSIKFVVSIYRHQDAFVIDCTLKKGTKILFFDIIYSIYSTLYKNIHF
jgi:5'-AMP-activated protein kinase, catalytic alpha subunit